MVRKRLINLETFELKAFEIQEMPRYAAISHVWSENLLPLSALNNIGHTEGVKMVQNILQRDLASTSIRYYWADGYCINQDDEGEELGQMPLMADIIRNAEHVITTVEHKFTFT